jgi:hypothetical protein
LNTKLCLPAIVAGEKVGPKFTGFVHCLASNCFKLIAFTSSGTRTEAMEVTEGEISGPACTFQLPRHDEPGAIAEAAALAALRAREGMQLPCYVLESIETSVHSQLLAASQARSSGGCFLSF